MFSRNPYWPAKPLPVVRYPPLSADCLAHGCFRTRGASRSFGDRRNAFLRASDRYARVLSFACPCVFPHSDRVL